MKPLLIRSGLIAVLFSFPSLALAETIGESLADSYDSVTSTRIHLKDGKGFNLILSAFALSAAYHFMKKEPTQATAIGGLGVWSLVSAFSIVQKENPNEVKDLQKSPEYLLLEQKLGKQRAHEFIFDVAAGYSFEQLQQKFPEIPASAEASDRQGKNTISSEAPDSASQASAARAAN